MTEQRIAAVPGNGLVYRDGDVVLVVGGNETPDDTLAERLIAAMSGVGHAASVRALARLLLSEPSPPPVAVVAIDGRTASIFAFGDLDIVAGEQRLSSSGAVLGVNEQVDTTEGLAVIAAGTSPPEIPSWASLRSGAVSGAGVVVTGGAPATAAWPAEGELADGTLSEPDGPSGVEDGPAPEQVRGEFEIPVVDEPEGFEVISLEPEPAPREPLPIDTGSDAADSDDRDAVVPGPAYAVPVEVLGVRSPRGHFNHPEARYCWRSGVKMGSGRTKALVTGVRPPLGVVTFDDGSTYTVQWNTVLGRDPFMDDTVRAQTAAPLVIVDDSQSVSRRHVFLELVDWDVLVSDLGSQNGTSIKAVDSPERLLGTGERVVMRSGTTIRFGNRSFVYDEHHVR